MRASGGIKSIGAAAGRAVGRFSPRHLAFAVPILLLHLACGLIFLTGFSGPAVAVLLASFAVQVVGITLGYHRLLAHASFKTFRPVRFVLALCGVLACQNGPLWWVGHHRHHHRHADTEEDVHSPRESFFWSHMGWLFSPDCIAVRRELVRDLARLPEMRFLERGFYPLVLAYAGLLFLLGEGWRALDPATAASGMQFVVAGSIISTVLAYHAIWSANSVCHRFGSRRFATRDGSRNNLWVAIVTFGDGWHHNHHYCPWSARHGFRWWEIDLNYLLLRALSRLGLVWDIRLPPPRARG
ncbi:acyl-CoA desaturase [Marinimicrococcus flavescens]|uniref:Acyl-CoA desaturase n=1 Tax=Marinimicrococcus flavescens TaxID=3031815 RepID=A0AAP3XS02_9PROT|nr:acyl-CoA desaturase [Marinimicrococcus flavescens]